MEIRRKIRKNPDSKKPGAEGEGWDRKRLVRGSEAGVGWCSVLLKREALLKEGIENQLRRPMDHTKGTGGEGEVKTSQKNRGML